MKKSTSGSKKHGEIATPLTLVDTTWPEFKTQLAEVKPT
jgi:hypothetical protein